MKIRHTLRYQGRWVLIRSHCGSMTSYVTSEKLWIQQTRLHSSDSLVSGNWRLVLKSVDAVNNIIQITIVQTRISHVPRLRDYIILQWYQVMYAFLSCWKCFSRFLLHAIMFFEQATKSCYSDRFCKRWQLPWKGMCRMIRRITICWSNEASRSVMPCRRASGCKDEAVVCTRTSWFCSRESRKTPILFLGR